MVVLPCKGSGNPLAHPEYVLLIFTRCLMDADDVINRDDGIVFCLQTCTGLIAKKATLIEVAFSVKQALLLEQRTSGG